MGLFRPPNRIGMRIQNLENFSSKEIKVLTGFMQFVKEVNKMEYFRANVRKYKLLIMIR